MRVEDVMPPGFGSFCLSRPSEHLNELRNHQGGAEYGARGRGCAAIHTTRVLPRGLGIRWLGSLLLSGGNGNAGRLLYVIALLRRIRAILLGVDLL